MVTYNRGDNMKEFDKNYYITKEGKVYSNFGKSKRELKTQISEHGYERIRIRKKTYSIHRLVAKYFLNNDENLPQVNHIDGNKLNNNVENIEWCNNSHNQKHAWDNNLQPRLRSVKNRVLTIEQAKEIRKIYYEEKTSQRKLAQRYSVSKTTIADLLSGKYYNHEKDNEPLVKNKILPKLTMEQAIIIRERFKNENISFNKLGKEYDVNHKTIQNIINNITYVQ